MAIKGNNKKRMFCRIYISCFIFSILTISPSMAPAQSIPDALVALANKDNIRGVEILQTLSKQGNVNAHAYLAIVYLNGILGVEKDEKKGVDFLKKAARGGNIVGLAYIGAALVDGNLGLQQDKREARRLLDAALKAPPMELEDMNNNARNIAKVALSHLPLPTEEENPGLSTSKEIFDGLSKSSSKESLEPDNRSPRDRYQGAFTAARLLCFMSSKLHLLHEKARERNLPTGNLHTDSANYVACQKKQLAEFKGEYDSFLRLQKSKQAKEALTEHYVAAVLTVKGTAPYIGESETSLSERLGENLRKAEEKWVRFEIVE